MISPLIENGIWPNTLSEIHLELHSKEHLKWNKRYKEDNEYKSKFGRGFTEYSECDDGVPSGRYMQLTWIKFHEPIKGILQMRWKNIDLWSFKEWSKH
jgi:hypothetical protein